MKYISFSLSAAIALVGCQTTTTSDEATIANNSLATNALIIEHIATPVDISHALSADETADVFHPVDDVEISLTDDVNISDDLWQRIRDQLTFKVEQNRRVIVQRNWYAKNQAYLDRVAKRAKPYPPLT